MRFIFSILFLFLSFNVINADERREIEVVAKIMQNSETAQMAQVWPNYNLNTQPIFITYGNKHIYAFNFQSDDTRWEKQHIHGVNLLYSATDHWGLTTAPMQFDFAIEGQKAFVFRMDVMNDAPFIPFFVLVHERFHVYQIQKFESEKDIKAVSYPENQDIENLALMQLEETILLDFLTALRDDSKENFQRLLKSYISINKQRRKLLSASSQEWEDRQQMIEGLADYVAAKNLDVFHYFQSAKVGQNHLIQTMYQYTQDNKIAERAIKWRHYGVGATLAYALDYLHVEDWKEKVEQNISLQSLLESHISLSSEEEKQLVLEAQKKYDFKRIKLQVNEILTAYNRRVETEMNNYDRNPGMVVVLQSPKGSGISSGGRSKGVLSLMDGSMLSLDDTSKASTADNFWNLELTSIPQLFQHKGCRRFKDEKNAVKIMIDGQEQALVKLEEREFHHLSLKGKSFAFKSMNYKGIIKFKDNTLSIIYE